MSEELYTIEQNNLEKLEKNSINKSSIEARTIDRGILISNEWLEIRSNMLTSSLFGTICKRRGKFGTLMKQIFQSKNMSPTKAYGIHYETIAKEKLEKELNIHVKECGLLIDEKY